MHRMLPEPSRITGLVISGRLALGNPVRRVIFAFCFILLHVFRKHYSTANLAYVMSNNNIAWKLRDAYNELQKQ